MSGPTDGEPTNERFEKVGTVAWQSAVVILVTVVLAATVAGLGFLVYRQRVTPEPFLLLVGIIVGFMLGRLDALL